MEVKLYVGDNMESLRQLPDNSVDSVVTDPPYGISFMAKKWDYDVPSVELWREVLRVLKPGGHALIACGTRTQHRMVVNIEDAGVEIRDVVSWIYGSGFPKSLNVSKAIDKAAGAEREVVGSKLGQPGVHLSNSSSGTITGSGFSHHTIEQRIKASQITAPATDEAKQWDGWGTALKPACEFFTLARKPLSEKTIAANVLKWGTGGINIDGCRVGTDEPVRKNTAGGMGYASDNKITSGTGTTTHTQGRFPANLINDGSREVLDLFPETKSGGGDKASTKDSENRSMSGKNYKRERGTISKPSQGSAARFFYCPKASKKDRDKGNTHPTVKPTELMRYLCRLITPAGGAVLDPFMGSGSTGKAAKMEGFGFVGMELQEEYFKIAESRIDAAELEVENDDQGKLF